MRECKNSCGVVFSASHGRPSCVCVKAGEKPISEGNDTEAKYHAVNTVR